MLCAGCWLLLSLVNRRRDVKRGDGLPVAGAAFFVVAVVAVVVVVVVAVVVAVVDGSRVSLALIIFFYQTQKQNGAINGTRSPFRDWPKDEPVVFSSPKLGLLGFTEFSMGVSG